jgi:hypothetical protein
MKRILKYGFIGLVAIVIISAIANSGDDATPTTTTAEVAQAVATAPPATVTTESTVPPTAASTIDQDGLAYAAQALMIFSRVQPATDTFISHADDLFWLDEQGFKEVAQALGVLYGLEDELQALSPPPAFEAAHDKTLAAAREYRLGATIIAQAIDDKDPVAMEGAVPHLEAGTALMTESNALLPTP